MSVNTKPLVPVFIHLGILAWGCFLSAYLFSGENEPRNLGIIIVGVLVFLFVYFALYAFGVWRDMQKTSLVCALLACVTAWTFASNVWLKEFPNHTRPTTVPLVITH
jgi:hypothetical protein